MKRGQKIIPVDVAAACMDECEVRFKESVDCIKTPVPPEILHQYVLERGYKIATVSFFPSKICTYTYIYMLI